MEKIKKFTGIKNMTFDFPCDFELLNTLASVSIDGSLDRSITRTFQETDIVIN